MPRRPMSLFLDILLILLGAALGIAGNYMTSSEAAPPPGLRVLQRSSPALIGLLILLILAVRLWMYWIERPPAPRRRWNSDRSPFPGLDAFTDKDAGVFFGRDAEVGALAERLNPALARQSHRVIAVIGPSGVGKSSLVHAGLIPVLAGRRRHWLIVPPMVPGDRPFRGLARSIAALAPPGGPPVDADRLAARLRADPAELGRRIERLREPHTGRPPAALLVVDQAEELLTLTGDRERAAFLDLLTATVAADERVWLVLVLRSEFLTQMMTSGRSELVGRPFMVAPLGRQALLEAIERPAEQAGMAFTPATLPGLMADDTHSGDALPLLAYTLERLYRDAGPGGRVTEAAYHRHGGVEGALTRQADAVTARLQEAHPGADVLDLLLKLVTLHDGEPTRRRVRHDALTGPDRLVVDALVEARLLTTFAGDGGEPLVEVAHEALFRHWAPLREAIRTRAEDLRHRSDLERWAAEWDRSGRRDAYLLHDERLRRAEEWAAAAAGRTAGLPLVAEFLRCSRRRDQAALERLATALARHASEHLRTDPEYALLVALTAVEECARVPAARQALTAALASSRVRLRLGGHRDWVDGVAWSPDGALLATASRDGTARIWDAATGAERAVLDGHRDCVEAVAWSPGGDLLATAGRDGTARVWRREPGGAFTGRAVLRGHSGCVEAVAWSPDGTRLATASRDGTARVWDAATGDRLLALRGHGDWVRDVAWSPDGRRLATCSHDRTVRVWEAGGGPAVLVLDGHDDWVRGLSWSPDGRSLATASSDRTARVWTLPDGPGGGREHAVLRDHHDWVSGAAWSPDGRLVATSGRDGTARVWDAASGTELLVLRGHTDWVRRSAWSPDGRRLATASRDGTARVWDVDLGRELQVLHGGDWMREAAWSADSTQVITTSNDRTARIWDAATGTERTVLRGHLSWVEGAAWFPDGARVVTTSRDGTARIWDTATGAELLTLNGHDDRVRAAACAPDGHAVITASRDGTARVWDTATGAELLVLGGHGHWIRGLDWSPDGARIATAARDGTARVWDAATGAELLAVSGHDDPWLSSAKWSPDGRFLATSSRDGTVRVWDAATGEPRVTLRGHEDWVSHVAWSPDGARIASASRDRTARIWDVRNAVQLLVFCGHRDWVECVDWSPDGTRILTACHDRTARIWDCDQGQEDYGFAPSDPGAWDQQLALIQHKARGRVFSELSPEQRRILLLSADRTGDGAA
ncbi:AAA family ATPase [Spirillospora sp. NPDC050679]